MQTGNDKLVFQREPYSFQIFNNSQGGWESDETVEEAACREALEEAGVRGILNVGLLCCMLIISTAVILLSNAW